MFLKDQVYVCILTCIFLVVLPLNSFSDQTLQRGGVLVTTSAGKVFGFHKDTRWGKVVQYFGIPYAEIIQKRFSLSVPLLGQNVTNIPNYHHNDRSPSACFQPPHIPEFSHPSIPQGGIGTTEDCLKINVYQPYQSSSSSQDRLPIVLFVPGDGYSFADMVEYDGSFLAAMGKVIVVTVNYRVGVFGFASMGNSTLPGNAGLSDIISALKFIIHNAEFFNGDSTNVTLAGRFSGAMAIATLLVSPNFYRDSKLKIPLANRVIIHGGVATSKYSIELQPQIQLEKLAKGTNCHKGNGVDTLACLQMLSPSKLQEEGLKFMSSWKPSISNAGIIFPKNPIEAVEFGKFPNDVTFLIGDNFDSGSVCYNTLKYLKSSLLQTLDDDMLTEDEFLLLGRENLKEFFEIDNPILMKLIAHEFYFRTSNRSSWRDAYFNFCGSLYLRNPVELFARYASRMNAVVYRYEFAYMPTSSIYPKYFEGALGDEIIFLFPTDHTKFETKDEAQIANSFMESWANFIKTGNPSSTQITWGVFNEINKTLIGITKDGLLESTTNNLDADIQFWRDVFYPLYTSIVPSTDACTNQSIQSISPPPKTHGPSVLTLSISIIGITAVLAGAFYVYLIRVRGRGYKWSW